MADSAVEERLTTVEIRLTKPEGTVEARERDFPSRFDREDYILHELKSILLTLAVLMGMFLPLEVFVLFWISLGPTSFWQKFATIGAGLYLGVSIQIVFGL